MDKNQTNQMDYCILGHRIGELAVYMVGEEFCQPEHSNGPNIRDPYLFHFIVSGEGIFRIGDKTYHLGANQGFLIPDSSIIYYQADKKNPWHYCWLSMQGTAAKTFFSELSLSAEQPIYTARPDNNIYAHIKALLQTAKTSKHDPYATMSLFYRCFSELKAANATNTDADPNPMQAQYAQAAQQYISANYHLENLHIEDIADHIGINRSYLTRLFTKYYNMNPQEYLIRCRMNKAKTLLLQTNSPISVVARSVGYPDVYTFSKMYKKIFGVSPSNHKKKLLS
ncbi:MAG: AraC family ligand binding domain-containing protein [Clostridia bacterium]|nr:AraC family ligand binding domain-containing protein [Clostridia bacterium]